VRINGNRPADHGVDRITRYADPGSERFVLSRLYVRRVDTMLNWIVGKFNSLPVAGEPEAALAALIDRSDLSDLVRLLRDTDTAADNGESLVGDETVTI
jgi:hypothetical protein